MSAVLLRVYPENSQVICYEKMLDIPFASVGMEMDMLLNHQDGKSKMSVLVTVTKITWYQDMSPEMVADVQLTSEQHQRFWSYFQNDPTWKTGGLITT